MLHDSARELDIKKLENQSQYDEALKNIIEKQSWVPDALDAVSKFKGMCKVKS